MLKNKLYNFFVSKNENVCYEYERFVKEHLEEHYLHRMRHIKLLIKLNWFYRIKKKSTPYLYWDRGQDYLNFLSKRVVNDLEINDLEIIRKSTFFEGKWYLEKYPDARGFDPAFHYLVYGWKQFKSPGPLFSTMLYLNRYDDARVMDINPLIHYEKFAKSVNREASYKGLYNVVKKEIDCIERSIYWNENWYKEKNLNGKFYIESPAIHYFCLGCYQGMDPSPAFSQKLYEKFQPEVTFEPYPHLLHFEQVGKYCRYGYFHQSTDYYNNLATQISMLRDINKVILTMHQNVGRRVLLISHLMNLTGAPKVLLNMAIILKNNGFFPVIATLHKGILDDECNKKGIPTVLFVEYEDDALSEPIINFVNLFETILFNTVESLKMAHILSRTKAHKLCWLHEGKMVLDVIAPKQVRRIKYMDKVFTCAEYCNKYFAEYVPLDKIEILHYGISRDDVSFLAMPISSKSDKFIVTIVGTVGYRKGHDILVEALKKIPNNVFYQMEFHIVGGIIDEDVGEQVKKVANENDNVVFYDLVPNEIVIQLISESCLLIVPSRDDPMPVVIAEAMILKIPVLMSDSVGTSALVKNGVNSFVLKENTSSELAAFLVKLYKCKNEIRTVGINGYEVYLQYLSDVSFEKRVLEIFNSVAMEENLDIGININNCVCLSDVEMCSGGIRLIFTCGSNNILEIYSDEKKYSEETYVKTDISKVCLDKQLHKDGKRIALILIETSKLNGFEGVLFSNYYDGIRVSYGEYVWSNLKKLSDDYGLCIQLRGNVIKFIGKNDFEKYILQSPLINNEIKNIFKEIQNINKKSRLYNLYVETRENKNDNAYQLFRHDLMTNEFAYFIAPKTVIEKETDEYIKTHYLLLNSERAKKYMLRSKIIVCSWYQVQIYGQGKMAYLYPFINLNYIFVPHGISYDKDSYYLNKSIWGYFSACIVASEYEKKYFELVNGYSNVKVLGYPRMDKWEGYNNEKEIILFPTWRNEITKNYIDLLIEIVNGISDDYKKIYIAHPSIEDEDFRQISNLLLRVSKNIICVNSKEKEQFNKYFSSAKFLITDYSSVAYDFAYKGGVTIYYRPFMNLESNYVLFSEFYKHNCGFIVDDLEALNKALSDSSITYKIRERVEDFYTYLDKNNTMRVFDFIKNGNREK